MGRRKTLQLRLPVWLWVLEFLELRLKGCQPKPKPFLLTTARRMLA